MISIFIFRGAGPNQPEIILSTARTTKKLNCLRLIVNLKLEYLFPSWHLNVQN